MSECNRALVDQIGRILGFPLPYCATITTTEEGGIRATGNAPFAEMSQIDINPQGEIFESRYYSDIGREICLMRPTLLMLPPCYDMDHQKLGSSVSPEKLARARKLILASQPKTPKADKKSAQAPTNQPAIASRNTVSDSSKTEKVGK